MLDTLSYPLYKNSCSLDPSSPGEGILGRSCWKS